MSAKLTFRFFDLPLKHAFTISRYTVTVQKTVVVTITDGIHSGYGEATVNPYYHSTVERLTNGLNRISTKFATLPLMPPSQMWDVISITEGIDNFALCAFDEAYWDFWARRKGMPLRSFWSGDYNPRTSYTIGLDTIDEMQRKIVEFPWPIYKIKLGRGNDIEIIRKMREVTDAIFRIDANAAWTSDEAISNAAVLSELGVEFIEQPLQADDAEGMKRVYAASVLPVIADESCQSEDDVAKCAGVFHGINIKLTKCGGITPALRMIDEARKLGLKVMAGCMTESTVGISALVQLAPLLDYIDADGALLLSRDIAVGATFENGSIVFPKGSGTGVEITAF